jgi:hypothetical protein
MKPKTFSLTAIGLTCLLGASCLAGGAKKQELVVHAHRASKGSVEKRVAQNALNHLVHDIISGDPRQVVLSRYSSMKGTYCTPEFLGVLSHSPEYYKTGFDWKQLKRWCANSQGHLILSYKTSWGNHTRLFQIDGSADRNKLCVTVAKGRLPHTWRVTFDAYTEVLDTTQ